MRGNNLRGNNLRGNNLRGNNLRGNNLRGTVVSHFEATGNALSKFIRDKTLVCDGEKGFRQWAGAGASDGVARGPRRPLRVAAEHERAAIRRARQDLYARGGMLLRGRAKGLLGIGPLIGSFAAARVD